ncbi:SAM-dependent methyltransferase [Chromohalobacter sp. 296-RDG]|uniref:uroporphyrinogen-III C-methyltransferase n=1 Tax=Chromohalobacter sp. 296-RDG TaxID=2994062 RepID=UPI0032AF831A
MVRLKGGDPGICGRMGEELAVLAEAGRPTEIVPGITAASAVAASLGMPLTDRAHAQQLRLVTAQHCRAGGEPDWSALARRDETLVFYMGLSKVTEICQGLRDAGMPDDWPIMLAATPLPSPCLIVVGSVVRMVPQDKMAVTSWATREPSCSE